MTVKRMDKKYQKTLSIACINFNTVWGNKAANLEKMKTFITEAARQGNEMVVFPEMALTGYECDEEGTKANRPCEMHKQAAETIPGPSSEEIAKLCRELDVYVVFGMPERDENDESRRYISAAVVGPEGVIGSYRKLHLAPPPNFKEQVCFQRGTELPVFETRFGRIGIEICYDFYWFPELARIQTLKGAQLIINITASPLGPAKPYFLAQQTGARATENLVYTASANLVGKDRTASFFGSSVIAGTLGTKFAHIYAQGSHDSEEIVSATLDFKRLHRLWDITTWRKDRQDALIAEEMQRLAGAKTQH